MKLLYITNGITGVGGLERVLSIKASYLADTMGYDVHIVSLNESGKNFFYDFSPSISFHTIEVGKKKKLYFTGLRRLVRDVRPDVISVCDDGLKGFSIPLWIGGRAKIIYERHISKEMITLGNKPNLRQKVSFILMNMGSRLFDRFVVLTGDNRSQWKGRNVTVIPNPLSFYPEEVSALDRKRIIAVGKVTRQKGYDRLAEAWKLIEKKHPGWQVDIYGVCGEDDPLREMVAGTSIRIHEPVRDIRAEYLSSSIYALPSRFEGFGMVLTEAMSCGVPCVAFACPCGPADIIRDGEDGFLIANGDIEAFAEKLSELIENEVTRKDMATNARANVRRYDIGIIAKQWDKLFREL